MHESKYSLTGNYCAYLRKSRADRDAEQQGEADVLLRHKNILENLATKMGVSIKKFYSEVVSGETIADRPVMRELLLDVQSEMWDGVLVVEVERLARGNTKDQGIVSEYFKYSNTKIVTPLKIYDPNDEYDEEYFEFGLFMARREYKTINRRLMRGRLISLEEGNYIASTAPYGYNRIKNLDSKGYTLEINEEEAKVVRFIFDWYCHGILNEDGSITKLGSDAIARRLDSLGITPRISSTWSRATISDILKNPIYYGDVRFGYKPYDKKIKEGTVVRVRSTNKNCKQNRGKHPAIIDYDLFMLAQKQKIINSKNTTPSSSILQNPLSGLVYCQKCGTLMTRLAPNTRNKYATLKCPNRYCNNVSSPLFLVEEQLLNFLEEWVANHEVTEQNTDLNTPVNKEMVMLHDIIKTNDLEIKRLTTQLNKAYDLLEQEIYTPDIFRARQAMLTSDIEILNLSNDKNKKELKKLEKVKYSNELFIPRIRHLLGTYSDSPAAIQNELLKEIIARIDYVKDSPNTRGKLLNTNFTLNIYPKLPH